MKKLFLISLFALCAFIGKAQLIPDMLADPSIVEINGTFYCYATTDGYGKGLASSGPPVLWKSKDFVNWSFDGIYFPSAASELFWAPSKPIKKDGKYLLYPTVNGEIYVAESNSPEGLFKVVNGTKDVFKGEGAPKPMLLRKTPKDPKPIDAEIFIDDDGKAYMFWNRRGVARLNPDLKSIDTTTIQALTTKRGGYSEGPMFFKRKGIYYYLYTLAGNEKYEYAYGMSTTSPISSYIFPEKDIVATTNPATDIYGPGHGCIFSPEGTDDYYFVYLEFGIGGTNRFIYANKMEFNADGTIKPIDLDRKGVGALHKLSIKDQNLALNAKANASSTAPDLKVKPIKDKTLNRTETYLPSNALDNCNGTRWLADEKDSTAWFMVDLGKIQKISRTEAYFVRPTAGQAYRLEYSDDAKTWKTCGGHTDIKIQSPHVDTPKIKARYLKITILKGVAGLYELKVY